MVPSSFRIVSPFSPLMDFTALCHKLSARGCSTSSLEPHPSGKGCPHHVTLHPISMMQYVTSRRVPTCRTT